MKTPPPFSRTRFFSLVRITSASVLLTAAAAMAFVAAKPSGLSWAKSDSKNAVNKFNQNRVQLFRNKLAMPGPEREGGPTAGAQEAYTNRAYPAPYVPFTLTRNAHRAWADVMARAPGKGINVLGGWTLAGPSTANFPDVLTFSGAAYTTSGRISALAIGPTCTTGNCTILVGAAGGGVFRTTNALSGNGPSWTFVSGSGVSNDPGFTGFRTNAIGTLKYDTATGTLYAGTGEPNASADSEAGFGIYKSTDNGDTWTKLAANTTVPAMATPCGTAPAYTGPAFDGRAISSI